MCDISIIKVSGNHPGLHSITVIGNVQRCDPGDDEEFTVQITCPALTAVFFAPNEPIQGMTIPATSIFIGSNGDFFATFDDVGDCQCGGQVLVAAQCKEDNREKCRAELLIDELECVECPEEIPPDDDVVPIPHECVESEAMVEVTLTRSFTNNTSNDLLFEIVPGHPDAVIMSGGLEPIDRDSSGEVSAVVRYPTLSFPQPYVVARLATTGELLGCPPWLIPLGRMPDCCPDVTNIEVKTDGCQVVVNVEPINVPLGCEYYWNFDCDNDDSVWETGTDSQRVHQYDNDGKYKICVKVACGRCVGDEADTEVEISGCKESTECQRLRWTATFAAAFAILAGLLAQCFPAVAPYIYGIAAAFVVASVVASLLYGFSEKCKSKPCRIATLTSARTMLIAGYAAIALSKSKCCGWMMGVGLVLTGGGLGLLMYWRARCEKPWCDYFKEIAKAGALAASAFAIVALIPALNDCINWKASAYLGVFPAISGGYAAADCPLLSD